MVAIVRRLGRRRRRLMLELDARDVLVLWRALTDLSDDGDALVLDGLRGELEAFVWGAP